jgi:hypothetical protein
MTKNKDWGKASENNIGWGASEINKIYFGYIYKTTNSGTTFLSKIALLTIDSISKTVDSIKTTIDNLNQWLKK